MLIAHEYDESLLLEDQTTTEAPSEGFVIATTSTPSSECHHNGVQYYDGELIVTDQPCEHCYCMRGDIVCAVQECAKPTELDGKNCTRRAPAPGECCAKDYDCVSDEQATTILPGEEFDETTTVGDEHVETLVTTTSRASLEAIVTEKAQEVATESDVAEVPTTERVDDAENEIHDKDYDHITSKPAKIDNRIEPEATTVLAVDEERMVTGGPSAQTQPPSEGDEGILANLYTTIKSIVDLTTTLGSVSENAIPEKHVSEDDQSMLANVIPGEGDCLENGVSYLNSTSMPSRSNCEISCVCLNSIVRCEKIQCSRIPPNAQNCRRIEDPSQCCPRYECDSLEAPVTAVPLAMDVTTEQEKSEATTLGAAVEEEGKPEAVGTTERSEGTTVQFEAQTKPSTLHLPISSKLEDSLEQGTEASPGTVVEQEKVTESSAAATEAAAGVTELGAAVTEAGAVGTDAVVGGAFTTETAAAATLATRLSDSEQEPIATEQPVAVERVTVLAAEPVEEVQATTSRQEVVQEEGAVTTEQSFGAVTEQDQAEVTTAHFVGEVQPGVASTEADQKPAEATTIATDQKVLDDGLPEATTPAEVVESESFTTQRQQDESIASEQATTPSEVGEPPIAPTETELKPELVATTPQSSEEEHTATKLPSLDERVEVPATAQPEEESGATTRHELVEEDKLVTLSPELAIFDEPKKPASEQQPPLDVSTESVELATEAALQTGEAITEGKLPESEVSSTEVPAVAPIDSERVTEAHQPVENATQRLPEVTERPIETISSTEAIAADEILASEDITTQRQSELENEIPTQRPVEIESAADATEKPTEEVVVTTSAAVAGEQPATEIPAQLGDRSTEAPSTEAVAPSEEATTVKSVVSHDEVPETPELTTESREQAVVTEKQVEIEQKPTVRAEADLEVTTVSRGIEEEIAATTQQAVEKEVTTERQAVEEESPATTERRPSIAVEPEVTEKPVPAIVESVATTELQPSLADTENRIQDEEISSTQRVSTPAESEESAAVTTDRQAEPIEMHTPEAVTMKRDESITESYNQERITESSVVVKEAAPAQGEEWTTFGSERPVDTKGEGEVTEKQVEQVTEEKVAAEVTTEAKIEGVTSKQGVTPVAGQEQAEVTTLTAQANASTEKAVEVVTEARGETEVPAVVSEISAPVTTEAAQSEITTQKAVEFSATEGRLGEESTEVAAEITTPARIADEPVEVITENVPAVAVTSSAEEATTLQAQQVTTAAATSDAEIVTEQRIVEQESSTQGVSKEVTPSSPEPAAPAVTEIWTTERVKEVVTQAAAEGESTTSKQAEIEPEIVTQAVEAVAPEQATTEARIAVAATTVSDEIQTERQPIAEEQPIVTEIAPQEIAGEQTTLAALTEKSPAAAAVEITTDAAIVKEEVPTTAAAPARDSEQELTEAAVPATEAVEVGVTEGFIGSKFEPIVTPQAPFSDEEEPTEDAQKTTVRPAVSAGGDQAPEELTESPIQPTDASQVPSATQVPGDVQLATEENVVELSTILNRIHEQAAAAAESTTLSAAEKDEVPLAVETTQAPLEQPATTEAVRDEEERGTTSAPALPAQEIVVADDNCTGTAEEGAIQTTAAPADETLSAGPVTEVNKVLDLTTILSPQVVEGISAETTTAARQEPESVPSRIDAAEKEQEQQATTEATEVTRAPAADEFESIPTSAPAAEATIAPAVETTVAPAADEQPELPAVVGETQTQRADSIPSEEEQPPSTTTFIFDTTTIKSLAELITTLQPIRQDITEKVAEATTAYNRIDTDEFTSSSTLAADTENKTIASATESPVTVQSANKIPLIREPAPEDEIIDTTTKLADNFDITTLPSILSSHTTEQFISDSITTIKNKQNEITESETAAPAAAPSSSSTTTATSTSTTTTTVAPPAIYQPETEPEYDTQKPPSYAASGIPSSPSSPFDSGYGNVPSQYPDEEYTDEEEPAVFGPGTCRYGGKLYVSAQQIPRDDPCDFCFCFRSDIICLQQSCPPPITGCHEEPIQGFCCPRYECPVSMGLVLNATSTTTTTTLPPHLVHFARNNAKVSKRGCQIQGKSYLVGERVLAASGPCIDCM